MMEGERALDNKDQKITIESFPLESFENSNPTSPGFFDRLDKHIDSLSKPKDLSDFEAFRITDKTDIKIPIPLVTINQETIITSEAISTISGQSKSGKSAITGVLIAGAICTSGAIDGLEGIVVRPNPEKLAVIHIDTEQARHKQQSNLKSILKRAGMLECPANLLSYNIRQLDIEKYAEVTNHICESANREFSGIHSIWIDGGADYIADVNDAAQSNAIVKFFEDLAIKYHTAVIIIVHTNPGSDKERGHFGSTCQRKSESVLMIKKNGDISSLEAKFLRNAGNGDVPKIEFAYNKEKGYHTYVGIGKESIDAKTNRRLEAIQQSHIEVFSGQRSYAYKDAIQAIMSKAGIAERTAKDYFAHMKSTNLIYQADDNYWRNNVGK